MSGHSKWANIKNKKEKTDAQRGKIFTKIGREIAIAVKEGGSDPSNNSKLFLEIGWDQAKEVSELLQQAGYLDILVSKDYAGHDRVVCGRWKG